MIRIGFWVAYCSILDSIPLFLSFGMLGFKVRMVSLGLCGLRVLVFWVEGCQAVEC